MSVPGGRLSRAGSPVVLAGEAVRIREGAHVGRYLRSDPALELGDVLRIDRQPRRQLEVSRAGRLPEQLQLGPRRLGIDVVERHRRDTAPVVDAGVEQARKGAVAQV